MKYIYFILAITLLSTCKDDSPRYFELASDNYLVFGRHEGLCSVPCTFYYAIEENRLLLDTREYSGAEGGSFIVQSPEKFGLVKDLPSLIPQEILDSPDTTFSSYTNGPNISDGRSYKVIYKYNGVKRDWRFKGNFDSLPPYAQDFLAIIDAKLALLGH